MDDDLPFSERSFVSTVIRDSEAMSHFPDNRPSEPRVFVTRAINITREELDDTFSELHTPWKPQESSYTVKDWRRSVMFSQLPKELPTVPNLSDGMTRTLDNNVNDSPRHNNSPRKNSNNNNKSSRTSSSSSSSKRKKKTPYLSRPPQLLSPSRSNRNKSRRNRTPRSPTSPRTPRSARSPRQSNQIPQTPTSPTSPSTSPRNEENTPEGKNNQNESSPTSTMSMPNTAGLTIKVDSVRPKISIETYETESRNAALRGKYLVAVELQDKAIKKVRKLFGLSSQRIRDCCTKYIVLCNSSAMSLLNKKYYNLSEELLIKANEMTVRNGPLQRHNDARIKLRTATMSNLGCYWKSRREYGRALTCLKKAAKLEEKALATSIDVDSPATTHLNICSVLSALGRHAQARDHACVAIQILNVEMDRAIAGGGDIAIAENKSSKLRITALYNKAVEEMWLFQYNKAEQTYVEALDEFIETTEGNQKERTDESGMNTLKTSIQEGLEEVKAKIALKKEEKIRMDENKAKKLKYRMARQEDKQKKRR